MPADELDPKLAAATRLYVYGREQELRRVFLPTARRWLSGWRRRWEEVVAEAEAAEKNSSLIDEILHDKTLQRREEKIPSSPQEWLLIQAIRQDKTLVRRPEEEQQQLDDKIRELIVLKEKSDEELARFARKPQELEDQKQNTLDGMLRKLYASQKPVEQYFRPHARLLADEQVRQRVSRRVANEIRPIMDELFVVFEIPERAETWTAEFERRLVSELQRIADEEIVRAASSGRPTAHQNAVDQRTQQIGDRAVSSQSPQSGVPGAPVQGKEVRDEVQRTSMASMLRRVQSSPEKALRILIEYVKTANPREKKAKAILKACDAVIAGLSEGERARVRPRVHAAVPDGWKDGIGEQPTLVEYWNRRQANGAERRAISTYVFAVQTRVQ